MLLVARRQHHFIPKMADATLTTLSSPQRHQRGASNGGAAGGLAGSSGGGVECTGVRVCACACVHVCVKSTSVKEGKGGRTVRKKGTPAGVDRSSLLWEGECH